MTEESEIIVNESGENNQDALYSEPVLVYSNTKNSLYRVTRQGKYLLVKTGNDSFSQSLLQREYDLSLNLAHPNLSHIWCYEQNTPVGPGLVMEYINGRPLSDYLAERPSLESRMRTFGQLLDAVSYIHHMGVIHNDLKPENILVTSSDNDVKLIDFGLSDNDAHVFDRNLGGTRGYCSPELLSRESFDCRSDIYSLGMIMRKMFGWRFCWISRKCTRYSPVKRYADMDALSLAWRRRNTPSRSILSILVLTLILVPSLLFVKERKDRLMLDQKINRKVEITDSLTHIIGEKFQIRYEAAVDSISVASDKGSRVGILNSYLEYTWKLMDTLHDQIDDPEIDARIDAYCNKLRSQQQERLMSMME